MFFFKGQSIYNPKEFQFILGITIGSVIPDLQGMYAVFIDSNVKLHGFSHTLIGGLVYAIIGAVIVYCILFMIDYNGYETHIAYSSSLLGIYFFHFVPDMLIWSDMQIYWPWSEISYGKEERYYLIAFLLSLAFILGVLLYTVKLLFSDQNKS